MPPLAARVVEYEVPTVAPGTEVVWMASAVTVVPLIVSVNVAEALEAGVFASAACTEKVEEPPELGVPLNTPLEFKVIPGGNAPAVSFQL